MFEIGKFFFYESDGAGWTGAAHCKSFFEKFLKLTGGRSCRDQAKGIHEGRRSQYTALAKDGHICRSSPDVEPDTAASPAGTRGHRSHKEPVPSLPGLAFDVAGWRECKSLRLSSVSAVFSKLLRKDSQARISVATGPVGYVLGRHTPLKSRPVG